ncbi:hypothetical protein HJFPF1_03229 [Paramyrothecium foliicola]|nr:hypothetical protein HJFPF1_03229 [Paramyrothecium foliicola]
MLERQHDCYLKSALNPQRFSYSNKQVTVLRITNARILKADRLPLPEQYNNRHYRLRLRLNRYRRRHYPFFILATPFLSYIQYYATDE